MKSKPRYMKKILGIGDDSTMDLEKSSRGMEEEEDEGTTLRRRSQSKLRGMIRARTLGETEEPTEVDKVRFFFIERNLKS